MIFLKKIIIAIILITYTLICLAENPIIDTIEKKINSANEKEKLSLIINVIKTNFSLRPVECIKYFILGEETHQQIAEFEGRTLIEDKEKAIGELFDELLILKKQYKNQKKILNLFAILFGITLIILFVFFTRYRRKKKQFNLLRDEFSEQKSIAFQSITAHDRYFLALNSTEDGLWDWDLINNNIYFSPQWKNILKYDETEIKNDIIEWISRIYKEDVAGVEDNLNLSKQGINQTFKSIHRIRKKNGEFVWVLCRGNTLINDKGRPYRMVGTMMDINDQKKIEAEIQMYREHLEAMVIKRTSDLRAAKEKAEESERLKSSFLNNMSHEIRTPMNAIFGFSNLLINADLTDAQKREYVGNIKDASLNLIQLIEDILELAKIETDEIKFSKTGFKINDILNDLPGIFDLEKIKKKKHQISFRLKTAKDDENIYIFSDFNKLRQIFSYLIENAIKFTDEGHIEAGFQMTTLFQTSTNKHAKKQFQFYVKDTGIGIAKENHEVIFKRFRKIETTTKLYSGTGLGLTITKKLVNLLGGEIWVESEVGKGSNFYFTINYKM